MKTAKEMFEELGYEENYHIAYIMFYSKEEDKYIWFNWLHRSSSTRGN